MKTYNDQKKETLKEAKKTLEVVKEAKELGCFTSELKKHEQNAIRVVNNPEAVTESKVVSIANTMAQIKELDMSPEDKVVENWSKKELGIGSSELEEILEANKTPEEVKNDVLERMEAPKELIKDTKENRVTYKK